MYRNRNLVLCVMLLCLVLGLAACANSEPVAESPQSSVHIHPSVTTDPSTAKSATTLVVPTIAPQSRPDKPESKQQPSEWADEPLYVAQQNALAVYSMANGKERFRLPAGLLSADGEHYFAVKSAVVSPKISTVIAAFDPTGGQMVRDYTVDGRWSVTRVSYTGRWLVLSEIPTADEKAGWIKSGKWVSDFLVLDTESGKAAHKIHLDGNFEVDTTSRDGKWLFLIEHVPANAAEHYVIRLYDLAANRLVDGTLRDKTATEEIMTGLAWDGLASPNGRWLLTLYLNTSRDVAFIHSLDLVDNYPVCIDLPSERPADMPASATLYDLLKQYTLTLSPDGAKLYAANLALGVVAHIDLYSRQVVRTERFTVPALAAPNGTGLSAPLPPSVVSSDGRTLFITNSWNVWKYDTIHGTVDGPFLSETRIEGLGISRDGLRLYVAAQGKGLAAYDVRDSRKLDFPASTARTP